MKKLKGKNLRKQGKQENFGETKIINIKTKRTKETKTKVT